MKRILISLLAMSAFCFPHVKDRCWAAPANKIAATVGNKVITEHELEDYVRPFAEQYKRAYSGEKLDEKLAELRKRGLADLIDEKVMIQEAKRLGIKYDEEEVERRIRSLISEFGSAKALEEKLMEQRGMTLDGLRENLRNQEMVRNLVYVKTRAGNSVSPLEAREYYDKNMDEFKDAQQVKVTGALVRIGKKEDEFAARQAAEKIKELLEQGNDITSAVESLSGGEMEAEVQDLGFRKRGELSPEIDQAVFGLAPGKISEPVRSNLGYHVFMVEARKEVSLRTFEEAEDEIREKLLRRKADEKYERWMKPLREKTYIFIPEENGDSNPSSP